MTASLNMIRGRSNIITLTNNSGGALVAGDVCIQDTSADEKVTTTTSAASVLKVFVAAESIASGAAGRFYESGYCPLVNVNASVTRGRFLFTHTVAKQAAENATYGAGAFGKILKSGTTPSAIIYSATAQSSGGGVTRSGSTTGDHLAVWDGSNADSIKDGGAAGAGGATTFTTAYASPPTAAAAGDIWVPNNSFYALRSTAADSTHWVPWGPIFPMTPPPAVSGLTWVNQGGATATETNGGIVIATAAASGDNWRILKKAKGGTYTITAWIIPQILGVNYQACGLIWRQSSDGQFIFFGVETSTTPGIAVAKFTNATTFSANYVAPVLSDIYNKICLRIADNGSNRICSWSRDGVTFQQFHSVGRTDFITADEVGFGANSNNATYGAAITLLSWVEA